MQPVLELDSGYFAQTFTLCEAARLALLATTQPEVRDQCYQILTQEIGLDDAYARLAALDRLLESVRTERDQTTRSLREAKGQQLIIRADIDGANEALTDRLRWCCELLDKIAAEDPVDLLDAVARLDRATAPPAVAS